MVRLVCVRSALSGNVCSSRLLKSCVEYWAQQTGSEKNARSGRDGATETCEELGRNLFGQNQL
jgi:hypothetical protein